MSENAASASASILLADDDSSVLQTLSMAFRADGHRVEAASDGARALEALEKGRFEVLVLDILMPGATGWEVLAKAIEATPAGSPLPRAILITGFNQEYVVDMALLRQEGVAAMLLKPFTATALLDEIRRVLSLPPEFALPRPSLGATA